MMQTSDKQTSKSIVRNVVYGSLTWVLPLGLNLVATPVIVRSLGNNDYGIYALILGFIGYSFTFNFGRAITKYIAEYRSSGDERKIRDVISASFFISVTVGLCGVLLIGLLSGWLVRDVFGIDVEAQNRTIDAMYIASGVIFFWGLSQVFSSVLQGIQRFDVYSKIYTGTTFALISGNLALAYAGFDLRALLAWNLVVLLLSSIVFAIAAKKLLPEFGIHFKFERDTLWLVLRYSAGTLGYQILANILVLFERGWITQRLGTENLTFYVVPLMLGIYLHGFIASLVLVVFPLASELKDDREKLLKLYQKATKVISFLVVFIVTSVVVQGSTFLNLWMGEEFSRQSSTLLTLHIGCFGLIAILTVSWQMTEGLGFPQWNAAAAGVCTAIAIALMIFLTDDLGNFGVAVARFAGFATIFLSIFFVERWFFKAVQTRFWLGLAGSLAIAAVVGGVGEYAIKSFLLASWPSLALSVVVGGLSYCGVLWALNFVTDDERILIKGIVGR